MIITLAVKGGLILDCSKDDVKTVAETASDEMVMGAVRVLCEFSLVVSQQNHSELSLTALDDTLMWVYSKKGAFRELKMSKSAKAEGDELLVRESHKLQEQKIHTIRAAMEVQVYVAEKVTTTTRRKYLVHMIGPRQPATK